MNALRADVCDDAAGAPPLLPLIFFSLVFHIIILIVVPLLTAMIWKSTQFARPQTFTLVTMPKQITAPQQVVKSKEPPAPQEAKQKPHQAKKAVPKPLTKKEAAHPKKQEEQENVDELSQLLGAVSAPVSEIVPLTSNFKYPWYIQNLMSKVERFWKPPPGLTDKKDIYVTVSFSIFSNGTISEPAATHSSGNRTLDELALRAIKLAAPFGKLPVGFLDNKLDVDYILRPESQ
ncbi:MAG: energy transducer TonB [Chitinivibrionales bacterium]|nr:energy transducer TonB [Chitinivibrionales bacterium]